MNAALPADTATFAPRLDRGQVVLAWTVALGAFASLLDGTVVTVAIDRLSGEFHAPVSSVQWVVTGYLLALTVSIPLTGWAVERFGERRMWLASLGAFLVGSLCCGLAPSLGVLAACRALQGLGGGMLIPLARIIVVRAAGRDRIGRLMSIVMVPSLLAPIIGPLVGGLILDTAGWRWIFFLNAPIGVAGLEMARRHIHGEPGHRGMPLDRLGLVLVATGLAATMVGLSATGTAERLATPTVVCGLTVGPALLVGYLVHALRRRSQPLIDPLLFRDRSFAASSATVMVLGMSLFGAMLLLPLYYQQVRGTDAMGAGLLLAPQGVGMLLATQVAGRLIDRLGSERGIVLAGMTLAVLGTLPYGFADAHTDQLLLGAALVVRGAGLGLALPATMTATHRTLPVDAIPAATTASRTLQQLGAVLGATVLAVILDRVGAESQTTRVAAFQTTFWWSIGFSALGFLTAWALPTRLTTPTRHGRSLRDGERGHLTIPTITPAWGNPAPGAATDRRLRRSGRSAARVLRAVAITACVPYLALKIAWASGSRIGIPDGSSLLEHHNAMIVGSCESALLDSMVVVLVLMLTQRWGRRVPVWLLVPPVWAATGLLSPIMVGYPLQLGARLLSGTGAPAGGPAAIPFLHEWVFTVVYTGFIVQALALGALFVLYAHARWGDLWRGRISGLARQGPARGVQRATALMASAVLLVPLTAHLLWATGSTSGLAATQIAGRTSDFYALETAYVLFAVMTVTGLLLVAFPRPSALPLRLPLSLAFVGSAALACWGGYLMLTALENRDPTRRISELVNVTYSMQLLAGMMVFTMGAYFFAERAGQRGHGEESVASSDPELRTGGPDAPARCSK